MSQGPPDVAPRKATRMDDDRNQEIARCLFRESNDALFLFDPRDHRVVDANPIALRLTNADSAQVTAMRIWQLFSSNSERGVAELIEAYQRTGFFHSREGFVLIRRAGEPIPVNVSVSRIHTRPSPLGLVIARDISERLQAQEQLRESERRFRGLVESARVLILTLSASGTVTSANPEFEILTDWMRDEWLGRPFVELLHADDRASATNCFEQAMENGSAPLFEARVATKYAGYRDIEVLSLSRLVQGRTVGISLIARDVTLLRRAEVTLRQAEDLRRSKELAELSNKAKNAFLAQVSHEIRNPLASILSYAEWLEQHPHTRSAPEEFRSDLDVIYHTGQHLQTLFNDLLDLSRIELGQLRVEMLPCEPARVIDEVASTLRPQAEAAGATLRVDVEPASEPFRTDPARLRQILLNLVGNAIQYSEGGLVEISAFRREGEGQSWWVFEIVDDGHGLAPEDLARIFEPFERGAALEARKSTGAGLGLSISRGLAERLGGSLTARSQLGEGSTFTLELPFAPHEATTSRASTGPSRSEQRLTDSNSWLDGKRLLLAEDSEANRRVVTMRLERDGATVVAVGDGRSALECALEAHAAGRPFDFLLLDLQMPEMDGVEVAERLRESGMSVPLIALTAYAMAEDRARCLELGFLELVTKPIDWEHLLRLLQSPAPRVVG